MAKISNNICMFGAGCLWALVSLEVFIWLTSDVRLMFYYLPYSISIFLLLTSSTVNGFVLGKINTCQLGKLSTMGLMLTGFSSVLLTAYVINHAIYEGNLFDFVKKVVVFIIIPLNITLVVALLACFRPKISDKNNQRKKNTQAPLLIAISSLLAGVTLYVLKLAGIFSVYYTTSQFIISTLCIATPFVFMSFYIAEKIRTRQLSLDIQNKI